MKQPPLLKSSISVTGSVITMTGVNQPLANILAITDLSATPNALIYLPQGGIGTVSSYTQAANSVLTLGTAPSGNNLQIIWDNGLSPVNPVSTGALESGGILATISTAIANIYTKILGSIAVTGTFWQATQPVSASALPLPTGAATSANQTSELAKLDTLHSDLVAPLPTGSNTIGSVNVLGGNATAVKVDGTAAIQLGSGVLTTTTQRVTLATDGPEVTNSTAIKNSVASIPAKGAATTANSTPVNIASDQVVPISASALPLPTGAASSANQATTNATLSGILTSCQASTPAGANLIGGVNIQQGGNTLAINVDGSLNATSNLGPVANFTATGAIAVNLTPVGWIDVAAYRTISIHVTSFGSGGNLVAELSNDNSNWVIAYFHDDHTTAGIVSAIGYVCIVNVPTYGARYFRLRFSTAQSSGTTTIVAYPSLQHLPPIIQQVTVQGTVNTYGAVNVNAGSYLMHSLIASGTTNATSVKNNNANLGSIFLSNSSASVRYVKFFNKGSAPIVGTDTPIIQFPVQAGSSIDISVGQCGLHFTTGLAYCITTGSALLDATAVTAGDVLINLSYS